MMGKKSKLRLVRLVDFTAESLEAEANGIPNSRKEDAEQLRKMAKLVRELDNPKRIWVQEEQSS